MLYQDILLCLPGEMPGFFYLVEEPIKHLPIHVHVRYGGGEAVFDVDEVIELRESQNLKMNELRKAQKLAEENRNLIKEKWYEYIG